MLTEGIDVLYVLYKIWKSILMQYICFFPLHSKPIVRFAIYLFDVFCIPAYLKCITLHTVITVQLCIT
jgi:hypothetical protein